MNKFITFLTVCAVALGFSSCGGDDDEGAPTIKGDFKVNTETLDFNRTGGEKAIYVVSSTAPQATSDASWLTVGNIGLNGSSKTIYAISVTATENSGYDTRTATVTVTAGGQAGKVTVSQSASEGLMLASGFTVPTIPSEASTFTLEFDATDQVKADEYPSWVKLKPEVSDRSLKGVSISFEADRNFEASPRTADFKFSLASHPEVTLTVTMTQQAGNGRLGECDMTAMQTAKAIGVAVNIGNTLEATGGETSWGAARINEQYINGIVNAGFKAVRLPVAWYTHADKSTLTIDAAWMDRVNEVVRLCVSKGLYVFMNIHWDNGWMEEHDDAYDESVDNIQRKLWEQIAAKFNYFDSHLIFCGANEAGQGTKKSADALRAYMQTFVDVVRATGGNNAQRVLVIQGTGTDINNSVKYSTQLPTDPAKDRLMFEVHYYDPSDFTIMDKDDAWAAPNPVKYFWGKDYKTGTNRDCTWGDETHLKNQMKKMKTNFVDKGIPVLIGEYGCGRRTSFLADIDVELHRASRAYYHKCVVEAAKSNGCIPCYWETPNTIFDRQTGMIVDQQNLDAIMQGAQTQYPF